MKTTAEFIDSFVNVSYLEADKAYGHYPFQLFVETKDGSCELNALFLAGDILSVCRRVRQYVIQDAKMLFLSVDFPAGGDIDHDFVCVISVQDRECTALALPYDPSTGERFTEVKEGIQLSGILAQFKSIVFK